MKTVVAVFAVSIVLTAVSPGSARMRLYSREKAEKKITDSLRVVDSIANAKRIGDSLRVADSCIYERYRAAGFDLRKEKARKAEALRKLEEERKSAAAAASPDPGLPGDVDNISARTVVIDPENAFAKEIDSLQAAYDRLNDRIHSDELFRKMKAYPISEKRRYMNFLLKNGMKDTSAVLACCNSLYELYTIKHELLLAIQKSQHGNTRGFIQYHVEEHKRRMSELSRYLLALTPEVPFYPERSGSIKR